MDYESRIGSRSPSSQRIPLPVSDLLSEIVFRRGQSAMNFRSRYTALSQGVIEIFYGYGTRGLYAKHRGAVYDLL